MVLHVIWRTRRIGAAATPVLLRRGPAAASRSSTRAKVRTCERRSSWKLYARHDKQLDSYVKQALLLCARTAAGKRCSGTLCVALVVRDTREWMVLVRPHRTCAWTARLFWVMTSPPEGQRSRVSVRSSRAELSPVAAKVTGSDHITTGTGPGTGRGTGSYKKKWWGLCGGCTNPGTDREQSTAQGCAGGVDTPAGRMTCRVKRP